MTSKFAHPNLAFFNFYKTQHVNESKSHCKEIAQNFNYFPKDKTKYQEKSDDCQQFHLCSPAALLR